MWWKTVEDAVLDCIDLDELVKEYNEVWSHSPHAEIRFGKMMLLTA
jgi:hypothetical protein